MRNLHSELSLSCIQVFILISRNILYLVGVTPLLLVHLQEGYEGNSIPVCYQTPLKHGSTNRRVSTDRTDRKSSAGNRNDQEKI